MSNLLERLILNGFTWMDFFDDLLTGVKVDTGVVDVDVLIPEALTVEAGAHGV